MLRSIQDGPGDQSGQDSFTKVEVVNVKPEPNFYDQEEARLDTADKGDIYYDITKSEYEVQTVYWSGTPIKKRDGKTVLNDVVKEEIVKEEKEEEVREEVDPVEKLEEDADYSDLHVIENFVLKSEQDEEEDNTDESSNSQNHDVKFESVDLAIGDVEVSTLKKKPDPFLQKKNHFFESYFIRACPICDTDFENLSTWKAHMDNVHNHNKRKYYNAYYSYTENGKAKCNSCNIIFSSKLHSLRMHSLMHLPYRNFLKCKLCSETKSQLSSIIKHIKKQHFGHLQEQSIHIQTQHAGLYKYKIRYVCPVCGVNFATKNCWKEHLDQEHKFNSLGGLSFELLDQHNPSTTNHMKYRCMTCKMIYLSTSPFCLLHNHALQHLPFKVFKCSYCEYAHSKKLQIIKHACEAWPKANPQLAGKTPSKTQKNVQRILDTNETLYICPSCGEHFEEVALWVVHLTQAHNLDQMESLNIKITLAEDGNRKYSCLICDKDLSKANSHNIRTHAFSHMAHKIYKCKICHSAFNKKPCGKCARSSEFADTGKSNSRKHSKRKKYKKSESAIDPFCDPLQLESNNVPNFAQTKIAIRTEKTIVWNQYEEHITFACPECNLPLATNEDWHAHINSRHDFFSEKQLKIVPIAGLKQKWLCEECGVTVHGCLLHAQRHKLVHMPYRAFICCICQHRSKTQNVLIHHIKRQHFTSGSFKCIFCSLIFGTYYERFIHAKAEHSDAEWPDNVCRVCMKSLQTRLSLARHMKTHDFDQQAKICHSEFNIMPACNSKQTNGERECRTTVSAESKNIIYGCPQCGEDFRTEQLWNIHIVKEHDLHEPRGLNFSKISNGGDGISIYKCSVCDELVKTSTSLSQALFNHASIKHMPFKSYKCSACGEMCTRKDDILIHVNNCKVSEDFNKSSEDKTAAINKNTESACEDHVNLKMHPEEDMLRHIENKHTGTELKLPHEEQPFKSYNCSACGEMCTRKDDILIHVNNCKVSEDFNKSSEDKTAAVNKNTESACEDHVNLKMYPEDDMLRHIENKHTGTELKLPHEEQPFKSYKCSAYGEMCTRKDDILIHVNNCKVSEDFSKSSEDKTAAVNKNTESACEDHVNLKMYPEDDMLRHIENKHTGTELKLPHEEQPFKSYKCSAYEEMCTRKDDILIHVNNCKVSEDFNKSSEDKTAAVNKNTESACEDHVNLKMYPEEDMLRNIENKHTGTELKLPHEEQPFKSTKCSACGEMCTRKDDILIHVNNCKVSEVFSKSSEDKTAAVNKNTESACEDHVNLKMYPEEDMLRHIENKHTGTELNLPHEEQPFKSYKCSACGEMCTRKDDILLHVNNCKVSEDFNKSSEDKTAAVNKNTESACEDHVNLKMYPEEDMLRHIENKHTGTELKLPHEEQPFKSYNCSACGEMCTRKDDILIHVNNCKVSEDFNKSSEDKTAAVNKNTESACEDHVNLKMYPEEDMLRHIENKHTGTELKLPHEEQPFKSYNCSACGEMCTRKDDILIHVNNCKVSEDFNKSSEDKTAAVNKNTESACEDHVNLKMYPEEDMLRHIENKHTGTELKLPHEEQPFKSYNCSACGEMCTRKDDILIHVNNCKVSEDFNKSSEDKTAAINKNTESACEDHVNLKMHPEEDMLRHIENKHTGTELKLPHEEQPFKSYKCSACGEMCIRKDDILIHVNNCKVSEDFNKSSEDKTAAVNKNTESACEDHVNLKMYPEEDMLRHIENKQTGTQLKLPHEEQLYKCSNCDMRFSNLLYSQQHAAKCTGEVKSSLAMLKRKVEYPLGNTGKSKEHKKRKKGEKSESVIDPFCDPLRNETKIAIRTVKTFLLNQYEEHITYACPECNLPLATNEDWHAHINSRHDFFSEKQLKIAPIAGEKQMWLCQECGGTVYGGLLTAQRHKLVHLPYRAFICSICQHRSKTQNMMISHIKRQHFTFGSFIRCIFCSMIFGTSYERSIHTKAEHCDAKWPNKVCRVCMKSFRKRSSLAEHMKSHDPDRVIYSCGYCKRKFCSTYERKIHWIQHHSKEYSTVQDDQEAKVSVQSQTDS